jgi:hypothetical protein
MEHAMFGVVALTIITALNISAGQAAVAVIFLWGGEVRPTNN